MAGLSEAFRNLDAHRLERVFEDHMLSQSAHHHVGLDHDISLPVTELQEKQPVLYGLFRQMESRTTTRRPEMSAAFAAGVLVAFLTLTEYAEVEEMNQLFSQTTED